MKRSDLTEKLLDIKREKGWSWKHICDTIGGYSEVLIVGAILGQMKLTKPQAANAGELFGLSKAETAMLNEVPMRGTGTPMPPTDPLIYRFYEMVMVNGPGVEGTDRRGIRRRHHVGDRLRFRHGALAQSEGRSRQDHHVGQVPPVQILRRKRQCAGVRLQGGLRASLKKTKPSPKSNVPDARICARDIKTETGEAGLLAGLHLGRRPSAISSFILARISVWAIAMPLVLRSFSTLRSTSSSPDSSKSAATTSLA